MKKICLSCKYYGLNMPIKLRICMLDRMYKGECKKYMKKDETEKKILDSLTAGKTIKKS